MAFLGLMAHKDLQLTQLVLPTHTACKESKFIGTVLSIQQEKLICA